MILASSEKSSPADDTAMGSMMPTMHRVTTDGRVNLLCHELDDTQLGVIYGHLIVNGDAEVHTLRSEAGAFMTQWNPQERCVQIQLASQNVEAIDKYISYLQDAIGCPEVKVLD